MNRDNAKSETIPGTKRPEFTLAISSPRLACLRQILSLPLRANVMMDNLHERVCDILW